MLFNYTYITPHRIETFQGWLDHLVKQVWCRAAGDYSLALLHPDLRQVVEDIFNDDKIDKDHLDGPIKTIDALFRTLTVAQRQQVDTWYDNNNNIEALCSNDPAKPPGTYEDIRRMNVALSEALKTFFKSLWTEVLSLKAVKDHIGDIDDHYDAFVAVNDEGKCPYCGYNDIKGIYHTKREAYDHYLPKGIFPFSSANFRNLAPMCHECNSSYKHTANPLIPLRHDDPLNRKLGGTRRKAFYSYAATAPGITVSLKLNGLDVEKLQPAEIDLSLLSPGRDEEVEGWNEVFGVDERYKAKCCAKNDGKYWLIQALDEFKNPDNTAKTADSIIAKIEENAQRRPWAECNFLKAPFLKACKDAGFIRARPQASVGT